MAGLQAVRNALATQIQNHAYPVLQVEANPRDQINPPVALVLPARGTFAEYGETLGSEYMGGVPIPVPTATGFRLDVQVIVARAAGIEQVQPELDQWFGYENIPGSTVSIPMAVAMDSSLGGLVRWCNAISADNYAPIDYNGLMYFGARIHFELALV